MKSLWTKQDAQESLKSWGAEYGEDVALRIYSARLIGAAPSLVLHGGGNVSVKGKHRTLLGEDVDVVYVKASGCDLKTLSPSELPGLHIDPLRRLLTLDRLDDRTMAGELRRHLIDPAAPTPSIETLVHAALPHRFIDHSHADAVLIVTNQPDGVKLAQEIVGDGFAVLPYIEPGFDLAKAIKDAYDNRAGLQGIVLAYHGLITFADETRESYEQHIKVVDRFEQFIQKRRQRVSTVVKSADSNAETLAASAAPIFRGLLAVPTGDEDRPYHRPILEWRASATVMEFLQNSHAHDLVVAGPITPDHVIRTGPWPLWIEQVSITNLTETRAQWEAAIKAYRDACATHLTEYGAAVEGFDLLPRVIFIPGAGVFCWGRTKRDAVIAADITEHSMAVKLFAHQAGGYVPLSVKHVFQCGFRPLQRAKVNTFNDSKVQPLAGQVVFISGGAGAIGAAIAEVCTASGAHVAIADLEASRCAKIVEQLETKFGKGVAHYVVMDVCDEQSVQAGYEQVVRHFGGLDVIVPNAGIAKVGAIDQLEPNDFRRVMEVNATGYFLFMREGIRILKAQGIGGHVVINASKNVFAPGKDFAAYSASKAAGHQLGKVAAIELAPFGIRVNMINADGVFGDEETPSGLWEEVGPDRARGRGITPAELPEYYRRRNLLKTRVQGRHIGNAVVFFASNATPTTGATFPIDGGIVEAFPR